MSDRGDRPSSSCRGQLVNSVSSSRLTKYDLQLRKVITPSSELRFECSWTRWKAHIVKNPLIFLRKIEGVRLSSSGHLNSSVQVSSFGLTTHDLKNFGRSYLLRSNSYLGVLGLYGKPIESRIHSYV